jgi:hypothetical protein
VKRALVKWKRRKKLKQRAVDYLGGSCIHCKYNKCLDALDFHHRDERQKEFSISKGIASEYRWSRLKPELDKCDLVCANCHRELHWHTVNDINTTLEHET